MTFKNQMASSYPVLKDYNVYKLVKGINGRIDKIFNIGNEIVWK